jgi:hypothetical protein
MFILGFHREMDEICALLGYYAAYGGNLLPMFRDNLSALSSMVKKSKKKRNFLTLESGLIGCSETSVANYHCTLRNIPEERISRPFRGGSPKLGGKERPGRNADPSPPSSAVVKNG